MSSIGDERQDLKCQEALKDLFKYVFNEVSRLLKDYPSQSNTICEGSSKLAVELQSLITYQRRHSSSSNMTTEDLVLFVTSMLALGNVTKNSSTSLPITAEPFIPTPLLLGDTENASNSEASLSLRQTDQSKTSTHQEQLLDESIIPYSRSLHTQSEPLQPEVCQLSVSQIQTAQTLPTQVKETLERQEAGDECSSDGSIDDTTEWSDRDQLKTSPTMERTRPMTRNVFIPVNRSVPTPSPSSRVKIVKRKFTSSAETPQKVAKQHSIQQSNFTFLKELSPIPKDLKQPQEVYQIFFSCCGDESYDTINLLTQLFFAVASPAAFYQLCDAYIASRRDEMHKVPRPTTDIIQTLQALD